MRTTVGVGILAAVVAASAVWLIQRASAIKDELQAASQLLPQLQESVITENSQAASSTVTELRRHTAAARAAANDPVWTIASTLPWLGPNFEAVSALTVSADDVAERAAAPLVTVFESLDWKKLTPGSSGIDLKPLSAAQPKLAAAAHAVRQSSDRLHDIDSTELLPAVSDPLLRARQQLDTLRGGLDTAADSATMAPILMGSQGPKRYLLLIQNNAELRATGGIPGALAVLTLDNGRMTLGSQTSASAMGAFDPVVKVDQEQTDIYSARLGKFMQDVNLTPDFPTSAQTALSMWKANTGEVLDGVLSIDPVALGYVLNATGPVKLNDPTVRNIAGSTLPTELTQDNVLPTLLSDVYSKITEPTLQDAYFAGVAQEVFSKLSAGGADTQKLLEGLTRGTAEHRILLWSSHSREQALISKYPLGGSITGPGVPPSQFGVYFNDGTGAKMDYHVKRTVQLVTGCTTDEYGRVKVRIKSTNTAPKDAATSLPAYVTGGGAFGVPPGTVQTNIIAYGPTQSIVDSVVADGKKASFASQLHSGRPVGTVTVALPPGRSSTVEFLFAKIVQHTEPELSVTPTAQAQKDVVLGTVSEKCVPAP